MDEPIAMSSPSPPKIVRRRSSFFEPRKSLPFSMLDNNPISVNVEKQDPIDLNLYIQKLEKEHAAWKSLYSSRKAKGHELKKKFKENEYPDAVDESYLYKLLPEEYQNLLQNRPDVEKIKEESIQFCEEWEYTRAISQELVESNQRVIHFVKKNVDHIKSQILENSILEFNS